MSAHAGAWREEARRLNGTTSHSKIAARLGVHPETIRRFFEGDLGENRILLTNGLGDDGPFIKPHVYRTPRRIDMGPVVKASWAAIEERRASL